MYEEAIGKDIQKEKEAGQDNTRQASLAVAQSEAKGPGRKLLGTPAGVTREKIYVKAIIVLEENK